MQRSSISRMKLLATLAVCSMAALAASRPSAAMADQAYQLDIPAQDLGNALKVFGAAVSEQVLFSRDIVAGLRSTEVKGEFTSKAAILILLKDSGLQADRTSSGVLLIRRPPNAYTLTSHQGDDPRSAGTDSADRQDKRSSESFRVAQVDQGQTQSTGSVEGQNEESAKGKKEEEQREELQQVIVTGTHIQGTANPTAPIIVIDRADIESSGYTTTQQLIDSIPQNYGGGAAGASPDGLLGDGPLRAINDSFASGINLRGLGESSTLVLVDGHRLAPSASGIFVDISVIPLAAIDRVEIMADGASAIYGADAVAGVVNFILRKDYQGQETWANYTSGTDGTRPQETIGQVIGRDWSGGNVVAGLQYQKQDPLNAADRSYTAGASPPTDLFPKSERYSALFNVRQELPAGFDTAFDVLYSKASQFARETNPFGAIYFSPTTNDGLATLTLAYRATESWRIEASASYSLADTTAVEQIFPAQSYCPGAGGTCHFHDIFRVSTAEMIANGTLFRTPGGDAKTAFGVSYRKEAFSDVYVEEPTENVQYGRHVMAEFAELEIPLVGSDNALPGMKRFDLSLAVRHDDYSDFGGTTNPRYGIAWKPIEALRFRTAYSTSFRTPNTYEDTNGKGSFGLAGEELFPGPAGGMVPVFVVVQGGPEGPALQPEKSRNISAGLDFQPVSRPDFKASVNYFNITYRDRIITPGYDAQALSERNVYGSLITTFASDAAAEAFAGQFQAQGGTFLNLTNLPVGVGVRYLLNGSEQNAALVKTNGVDLGLTYGFRMGGSQFHTGLNVTHIGEILTSYTATSTPTDLVNTYANPLHWRGRGQLGWSSGAWSINTAVNYSGSYVDTTNPLHAPVASWTTIDAQVAYVPPSYKNLAVSLSCINLLDRNPPYVLGVGQFDQAIHYDVGNANPLGRVVGLNVRLAW